MEMNKQCLLAEKYINLTHTSIFLTGKAGTGKTTFLKHIYETTNKRCIIVAPTGVAAINAGGSTIHSFFQLPPSMYLPSVPEYISEYSRKDEKNKLRKNKINIIRSIDLLIIDEISMVRADLLDAIDSRLRKYRRNQKPFGGVQLLLIGDLQQLPPIVSDSEWQYMRQVYASPFFFNSLALQQLKYITIELTHVYRQSAMEFVEILNNIRQNKFDTDTLAKLNTRYNPDFSPDDSEAYIRLTTHNAQADKINNTKLEALKGECKEFEANVTGTFPEYSFPTEGVLKLKVGAQVMFVRNDQSMEKRYYNGKIVTITDISKTGIRVADKEGDEFEVSPITWENTKYVLNETTKDIDSIVEGTFSQLPVRLAWAITIHKSQGLTFDKAIVDVGRAFTFGQVYVALSRCRTLEGLVLSSKITPSCSFLNADVMSFNSQIPSETEVQNYFSESQTQYFYDTLFEAFEFYDFERAISQLLHIFRTDLSTMYYDEMRHFENLTLKHAYEEIVNVAEKFKHQIATLQAKCGKDIENEYLQERISKASAYFENKLSAYHKGIEDVLYLEIENKEIDKDYTTAVVSYLEASGLKMAIYKAIAEQFTIEKYNKTKYEYLLSDKNIDAKPSKKLSTLKGKSAEFLEILKDWRAEKSFQTKKPAYVVLQQAVMLNIAKVLPRTKAELLAIEGFGQQRFSTIGEDLLLLVNAFCDVNKIKPQKQKSLKLEKGETLEITLKLFNQGKSIDEIAKERGFAKSTITTHLSSLVKKKRLKTEQIISKEVFDEIAECLRNQNLPTTKDVYAYFGGKYEFYQISIVKNELANME